MLSVIFAFIAQFDTYSHAAYFDRTQYSYGYGTKGARGAVVKKDVARKLALESIAKHLEVVDSLLPLSRSQKIALTSFSYNVGENAFLSSTLYQLVQQGEFCAARKEFVKWVHQSGKKLRGLVKRRQAERDLFSAELECNIQIALVAIPNFDDPKIAWR